MCTWRCILCNILSLIIVLTFSLNITYLLCWLEKYLNNHKLSSPSHHRRLGLSFQGHTQTVFIQFIFWGLQGSMVFSEWWCIPCGGVQSCALHMYQSDDTPLNQELQHWLWVRNVQNINFLFHICCHYICCTARLKQKQRNQSTMNVD